MPDVSPYGSNAYGVEVRPLDYTAPYAPTTKTYHGNTIVVNGKIIGRITSWNPQPYGREVTLVRELSNVTFGRPVDAVPGIATGFTIAFTRVEVWNQETEIAMGFESLWADLADQYKPFTIFEYLFRGKDLYRVWQYAGCWFSDRNEEALSAEGNTQYIVNATLTYVSRTRVF